MRIKLRYTTHHLSTKRYYRIDFDDVERQIVQHNIKLCIFCNPHNPSGRVWSREELERFGNIMKAHDVWLISDEIHCDIMRKRYATFTICDRSS